MSTLDMLGKSIEPLLGDLIRPLEHIRSFFDEYQSPSTEQTARLKINTLALRGRFSDLFKACELCAILPPVSDSIKDGIDSFLGDVCEALDRLLDMEQENEDRGVR